MFAGLVSLYSTARSPPESSPTTAAAAGTSASSACFSSRATVGENLRSEGGPNLPPSRILTVHIDFIFLSVIIFLSILILRIVVVVTYRRVIRAVQLILLVHSILAVSFAIIVLVRIVLLSLHPPQAPRVFRRGMASPLQLGVYIRGPSQPSTRLRSRVPMAKGTATPHS